MLEVVRDERACVLLRCDLVGKASEADNDADLLATRPQRLLEADLWDPAGCEGMLRDDGRSLGQHEFEVRVHDRLAVEGTILPGGRFARAEAVLASYEEGQLTLELPLIDREEAGQPAEMIIMSVAEHKGIEFCGVELENGDVVVERLRHLAKIDQNVAQLAPASRLRVH